MPMKDTVTPVDMVCLSHLRWNFVYQRPQHLMSRFARNGRVFFVEEPVFDDGPSRLLVNEPAADVYIIVPHVDNAARGKAAFVLRTLLDMLFVERNITQYVLWYYTPMALSFTQHLLFSTERSPVAVVYDCMDELSNFDGAPLALKGFESRLLLHADLVMTGGISLYEAKRHLHPNIHACPSSVDVPHFATARLQAPDPDDQQHIAHPRLGFFGVIDERMDLEIIHGVAAARPEWQLVVVGPVVKINPEVLPRPSNIHYLGSKTYDVLPHYIRGWEVALLPFARNDATRFISPTKTPEYLAAGKPVVSTSIADVVKPYGEAGLVRIADTVDGFIQAVDQALIEDHEEHIRRSDSFLAAMSWDATWRKMEQLLNAAIVTRASKKPAVNPSFDYNPASTDNLNMGSWACGVAQSPERPERNSDV
jgi:UDP-galactopyranose mutase